MRIYLTRITNLSQVRPILRGAALQRHSSFERHGCNERRTNSQYQFSRQQHNAIFWKRA